MKAFTEARTIVAAVILLAGGIACAQGPGQGFQQGFGDHRPPMERALGPMGAQGRFWNDPAMIERLKLTDDQRKAMDDILQQHRETLIDMRANVEKAELAMVPLMRDDQPNEAQILAQIDKVAQARAELEKANARFLLAIRAKLTPDQWKALREARMEHRDWRDKGGRPEGRERRQEPPQPGGPGGSGQPHGMLEDGPDHGPEGPAPVPGAVQ